MCNATQTWQHLSALTFQQYNGEVLGGLALARGKALVGSGVSLLRSGNEQCLIVSPLDRKVLIRQDGFCVTIPGHDKVGGTLDGTGQDDRAADPRLQVLGRQGDPQWLWRWKKDQVEIS